MSEPTEVDIGDFRGESKGPLHAQNFIENGGIGSTASRNSLVQWSEVDAGVFIPIGATQEKLVAGAYRTVIYKGEVAIKKIPVNTDDIIDFKDGIAHGIMSEVHTFWDNMRSFRAHGFLHKRGYLLYGPAGGGKTCIVQMIIEDITSRDGIVLMCNAVPRNVNTFMEDFRKVEPDRLIVCVFEDIDAIIHEYGEAGILSILDGESQIDNVLNIATTNYPEKLDPRIVSRPRRFDRIIKIGMPGADIRMKFFKVKAEILREDALEWAQATDGFSFGAMADLVISVKCLGISFEVAVDRLEKMKKTKASSEDYNGHKPGFKPVTPSDLRKVQAG